MALPAISAGLLTPAPSLSQGKLFLKLLVCCAVVWPVVAFTSGAGTGEYPRHRNWLRRACFYIAKLTLLFLIVAFGASDLTSSPGRINIACAGGFVAIRWA